MPYKPSKQCAFRGCPNVAQDRYCPEHCALVKPFSTVGPRPSASERGYDKRWQAARLVYLRQHPVCLCGEAAVLIDHIIPHKGDRELFWNKENWQPMCDACHRKKIAKEINEVGAGQNLGS